MKPTSSIVQDAVERYLDEYLRLYAEQQRLQEVHDRLPAHVYSPTDALEIAQYDRQRAALDKQMVNFFQFGSRP
jgi:hypothetical protein